ncbi:MAG: DUF3160 domain-containing protein [Polyangiales bacterium]
MSPPETLPVPRGGATTSAAPESYLGRVIAGRYALDRLLGKGGMGLVFEARHVAVGRRVAVKILRPEYARSDEAVARFHREAKAAASVGSPHIVEVIDFGFSEEGGAYLAMELLEGEDLAALVRRKGALEPARAVAIVRQVAEALGAAHARGIVHRDLKSGNVFVSRGDRVKVLDFGVSKVLDAGDGAPLDTAQGAVIGTAHYMAPEQASDGRNVDARADLYSLGCILFEVLTGELPFVGATPVEVLYKQVHESPRRPSAVRPGVPRALDALAQKLLAKDRDARPRDARAVLDAPARPRRVAPWPSWDRRSLTPGFRRVVDELGLDARVLAAVRRNGFAVLDRGVDYASPYAALRDIYRRELPLYVTADAVLHALFRSHEALVETFEAPLARRLADALAAAHAALPAAAARWPRESARDIDLYLAVARSLLAGAAVAPAFPETGPVAATLVARVTGAAGLHEIELFGRTRVFDFGAFAPRGPYAESAARERWFRGAMWLSRVEFNVVSRDCRSSQPGITPVPDETPREAVDALALAELLDAPDVRAVIARADGLWGALAGRREDIAPAALAGLRAAAAIDRLDARDVFERLKRAVGDDFPRTARTHPMPGRVRRLPAIATVLGPRVVPDAAMTRPLVHEEVEGRFDLGAADLALALGHEPAARYLTAQFERYPALRGGFERARAIAPPPSRGDDLYGAWFEAVRSLARRPEGVLPSFMQGDAWGDLRMNSIVAGYGQLRHANGLAAASSYDGAACAIPDAWVDPTPDLYDALLEYARRMRAMAALAGDWIEAPFRAELGRYLDEAERTWRVLRRVAVDELAGLPLTAAQRRFVGSVVEVRPSTEGYPLHTGWYLDLLPGEEPAMRTGDFVADWYASVNTGRVAHVGVRGTRLGLFVIDRGGPPRLMVGPVPFAFEHRAEAMTRLTDEAGESLPAEARSAPWASSYTSAPVPAPEMSIERADGEPPWPAAVVARFATRAPRRVGTAVVEFLDERRRVVARGEAAVDVAPSMLTVRWLPWALRANARDAREERSRHRICGRRLRVGDWVRVSFEHPRSGHVCEGWTDVESLLTAVDAEAE